MMGHLKMVTSLTNRLLSQVIKYSEYQTFVCFTVLRYPKYWVMYSIHSTLSMVGDLKFDHMKSGLFESHISNGPVFNWSGFSFGYSFSPNHSKTESFKIWTSWSGFGMVFDKMAGLLDFRSHLKSRQVAN